MHMLRLEMQDCRPIPMLSNDYRDPYADIPGLTTLMRYSTGMNKTYVDKA